MQGDHDWFVIGAGGQLGQAIGKELSKRGVNFIALSSVQLDVRDYESVRKQILYFKPKVIVNCAGWTDVPGAEKNEELATILNAYAVENIIKTGSVVGSIVVHISSDYVFSGDKNQPYVEADPLNPINAYGRSKALGELLISKLDYSQIYVFRTAWLYSEFGKNFVKTILRKFLSHEYPLRIVNDQFGNPTSAAELAFQIVESVFMRIPFGTYHAVNTNCASWYDLSRFSFESLNLDTSNLLGIPSSDFELKVKRPINSCLDTSKWLLTQVPEMRNWEIALQDTIKNVYQAVEREVQDEFRKNGN
jgi:dTDP-4-dehydrorhamnose reductase